MLRFTFWRENMNKSDIQEIVEILKKNGNQRFNAFFAAILTSNLPIRFYYNANDEVWYPIYYPEDTKSVIEQLPNLVLFHYDWQHFIIANPSGIESATKKMKKLLKDEAIKPDIYKIVSLTDFLNNADENKDELNIRNFIKSLIIELSDILSNECWNPSSESNIDRVTNDKLDGNYVAVVADRINALFKLLKLVEQNADLIPFIEERYEIFYQLFNK